MGGFTALKRKFKSYVRRSKKKVPKKSPEERAKNFRKNAVRTIPFMLLVLGAMIYQIQWFTAIDNIYISYDFSNIDYRFQGGETPETAQSNDFFPASNDTLPYRTQGEGMEGLMGLFVQVLEDQHTNEVLNLTQAAIDLIALKPQSLQDIEEQADLTIQALEDLYNALKLIDSRYILDFFKDLWNYMITSLVPKQWFEPGKITIFNDSWISLENLTLLGVFQVGRYSAPFFELIDITIPSGMYLDLKLSLHDVFDAFVNASFDWLVNATFQSFSNLFDKVVNNEIEPFTFIISELFSEVKIEGNVEFNGDFGLLPMHMKFSMNFNEVSDEIGPLMSQSQRMRSGGGVAS